MVRQIARRYLCAEEKFYFLFSAGYIDLDINSAFDNTPIIQAKMKKIIYFLIAGFILLLSFKASALDAGDGPVLRVCVADDKPAIFLNVKGPYSIYPVNSTIAVMEGDSLRAKLTPTKGGIVIGRKGVRSQGIRIKVAKKSTIYIDGRQFRGDMDIVLKDNLKLMAVNHVGLEDYLYGVLYHEVSHKWPMEVLKAQAIAARTFALYQVRQNKAQPYDLRNDIYSQMYGGKTSEKWSTTRAVDLTKDKVLIYNGDIFPTYYHATCAGVTEDAANLWNIDIAPLKGGVKCDFCKMSPHYKWSKEIPLWVLENKLKDGGYKIGKIVSVSVLSRDKSNRAEKVAIQDDAGVVVVLAAKDFRQMLGPNEVRSTNFDTSIQWVHLTVKGFGWGHGVGMCQWGAYGMADKNKTVEEILSFYYPGSEITTIDKIKEKL